MSSPAAAAAAATTEQYLVLPQWWLAAEASVVASLGWPDWALRTLAVLSCALFVVSAPQVLGAVVGASPEDAAAGQEAETTMAAMGPGRTREFRRFQAHYLAAFLVVMLADWLQGTNMYTLYSSYEVEIGTLFLTGFLSSAVFGTFLGIFVDRWGRRLGCIVYCVLEVAINVLEHYPDMRLLMLGRVLGGMSTSLLFSAFESWMVSEHRRRGFPEPLLASTFALASWGNGIMAIAAGFLAQVSSDARGDIGPFQVAIGLTVLCLVLVLLWEENTGASDEAHARRKGSGAAATAAAVVEAPPSLLEDARQSVAAITASPGVLLVGLSQACYEGAVFTFVFMWVPTLLTLSEGHAMPTGLVFSCFMVAMTIGGALSSLALSYFPSLSPEALCLGVYAASAATMAVPALAFEFWPVFLAFLCLETVQGVFNSCGAQLRSKYYPENLRSSIMTVFRLPLNLLVVVGTKLSENATDAHSFRRVFFLVAVMHAVALVMQYFIWDYCAALSSQRQAAKDHKFKSE